MRRYKVIGPRPVFDTLPGAEFERDLSPGVEKALLGVHLKIVEPPTPPDPDPPRPKPKRQPARTRPPRPKRKPTPQSKE